MALITELLITYFALRCCVSALSEQKIWPLPLPPAKHLLRKINSSGLLVAIASCAPVAVCAESGDMPVSTLPAPVQTALNPCFTVKNSGIRLPNGTKAPALELVCGGLVTWDVPAGISSFRVTLWRADAADAFATSRPAPSSIDAIGVRVLLDGNPAVSTVLHASTPPEQWIVPVGRAHKVSVETKQEYGAFAVYLGDAAFSHQMAESTSVRHVLASGEAYVNLGDGPRQSAFFDFHPGETVPIQAEFGTRASRADVQIRISPMGSSARALSVSIPLRADSLGSVGSSQWQVPAAYGPATINLAASADGRQVYKQSYQVALTKQIDLGSVSQSNFGIHESTDGSLFLQDDQAALWGAKWARFFVDWSVVEAKQGQYDWHWIDNVVQSYSAQHLNLLGVMGESTPPWITDPATQMMPAYARFVSAALTHFRGRINAWEVYNEIDSKFYSNRGFNRELQPTGDIQVLHQELQQMQELPSTVAKICCAPGGSDFLVYEKRLFDAGLIHSIDAVAMHPYQSGPPEEGDFGLNYVEMAQRLANLAAGYGTSKPVWTTEANWLIGPAGTPGVTAPQVTEHEQSQYLVRASLLSLGMHDPYFIHSPFFFPFHRGILVDSLASYAQMTSILANAQNAKLLSLPTRLYGMTATTSAGTVVALWTDSLKPVSTRVSGLAHATVQDMYGNALTSTDNVELSGSPVYLIGQGNPVINAEAPRSPQLSIVPPIASWKVASGTRIEQAATGLVHLTSTPTKYGSQLTSPTLNVTPNNCYVVDPVVSLHKGGIDFQVVDADTNKVMRNEYIYAVTGNDHYKPRFRIKTADATHLRLIATGSNPNGPTVSDFDIESVTMAECP